MTEYFILKAPKNQRLLALQTIDDGAWEMSLCPIAGAEHYDGYRLRLRGALVVEVKHDRRDEQMIWGWGDECLVHKSLLAEFEAAGLTGYRLRPARVRFRDGRASSDYKWLTAVGWAGFARPESGIRLRKRCPECFYSEYSPLTNAESLIDWSQWTGEDFFVVWPLANYTFITQRVADLLEARKVKSYLLTKPVVRVWLTDVFMTAGRLSDRLPDDLALKYGEPLGIENGDAHWIPANEVETLER